MTEMNPFKATHVLRVLRGSEPAHKLVMAFPSEEEDGALILYQRDEWNGYETAGYEMDALGNLTLFGNPVPFCLAEIDADEMTDALTFTFQDGWYKSHTKKQVRDAVMRGLRITLLDTSAGGDNDVLIGCVDECLDDVLEHHGLEEMPSEWSITDRTQEIYAVLFDLI